jgi:hypothetical protein
MNIEVPRKNLDLSSAIAEGDVRVLLMVLVHMTGDVSWLEPPYKPKRDVRLRTYDGYIRSPGARASQRPCPYDSAGWPR